MLNSASSMSSMQNFSDEDTLAICTGTRVKWISALEYFTSGEIVEVDAPKDTPDDLDLNIRTRALRNYGSVQKYEHEIIGYNNRLDECQAGFLEIKLNYLKLWNQEKNNIAKQIESYEELSDYLVEDLKSIQKQDDRIANAINDLGQKTLTDTMKYINNFLFNEIK